MKTLLCAIAKNENNYITEWVNYHKKIGFDHIVIYDNNDVDGEHFPNTFGPRIPKDYVTIVDYRGIQRAQVKAYNDCYSGIAKDYDWVAFLDIDEFLYLNGKRVNHFLSQERFNAFNAICINWMTYNDDNLITCDGDYSVKRFTTVSTKDNSQSQNKKIIRTNIEKVLINSPHVFKFNAMELPSLTNDNNIERYVRCCNSKGEACSVGVNNSNWSWDEAHIKHYRYKTLEEFITNKQRRGYATGWLNNGKNMSLSQFFSVNDCTKEKIEYIMNTLNWSKETVMREIGISSRQISLYHWDARANVGDYYSYWLLDKMGYNVVSTKYDADMAAVGSILEHKSGIQKRTKIWGSGLHNSYGQTNAKNKANYYAVRGQLTRDTLGLPQDTVLGDPGILISRYYQPKVIKKYKYGIVCHHLDYESIKDQLGKDYHIISVDTRDVESFAKEICECELILSSSLHGIIFAHSYNIPAIHLETINVGSVDNFKFKDYYSILDIPYIKYNLDLTTVTQDVQEFYNNRNKYIPDQLKLKHNQDLLIKNFPYKGDSKPCTPKKEEIIFKQTEILNDSEVNHSALPSLSELPSWWFK